MSTDSVLQVRDLNIQVVRKAIKNLHVAVYPPDGHVRVAAPEHLDDEAVRLAVIDKLAWIHRQRRTLLGQPRQTKRDLIDGETHYVWGRRYRLRVQERPKVRPNVELPNKSRLLLTIPPGTNRDVRERVLTEWYRHELKTAAEPIVREWAEKLDVDVRDWRVRKMRTKWGSCNPDAGRIWLNVELAKKAPQSLHYVVVHELLHLIERPHSARFEQLLDTAMPDWRTHRAELYRLPLGHEDWPSRDGSAVAKSPSTLSARRAVPSSPSE